MTMISPLSHDDLAARIKEKGIPVLLLDTCSILDIVRAPVREQIRVHEIKAVHTLLDRTIGLNRQVSLVVTKQVFTEFQEHLDEVTCACDKDITEASKSYTGILERMKALSPSSIDLPPAVDLASFGFPEKSRCLAEKLLQPV